MKNITIVATESISIVWNHVVETKKLLQRTAEGVENFGRIK